MAQRIFRKDDTSKWNEKYSNGSYGDVAPTGTSTDTQSRSQVTGTNNTQSLTFLGFSNEAPQIKDILFIVQASGTDALVEPNYELNVIQSISGAVITTKYPLTRNFNTGAEAIILRKHKKWTLDGGAVINVAGYDGNTGGFFVRLASKEIFIDVGTINGKGLGFNGGADESAIGNVQAQAGATPANNSLPQQTSQNGSGGGGARDNGGGQGASGGGGGNALAGSSGGANTGHTPGQGGAQILKTQLKIITVGAGGGGGIGPGGADNGGYGGDGGAVVILIAPKITITNNTVIDLTGENGNVDGNIGGSQGSGGGGGAAGDFLAKGEVVSIASNRINVAGGLGGASNGGNPAGGDGSKGYGHVDYARTFTGTMSSGTLSSRKDNSLNRRHGGAGLLLLLK